MTYRTVIVAKIEPGRQQQVAEIFGRSDATSLPHDLGVTGRSLYALDDVYLHVIEFGADPGSALQAAHQLPAFRKISDDLRPYISPYNPATWRSPQDAVATEFYRWHA
jgi:cyclase